MDKKNIISFKSTADLALHLGFSKVEAEIIGMKGTVIGQLDKERERRKLNNSEFAKLLGIPKSRWSSILSRPERVTLDYLLTLAANLGTLYRLTKKAV